MRVTALKQVTYDPSIFMDIATVDDAVRVILTPEDGMTSAHRWKAEAPYLMELMKPWIPEYATILDYGCGIGRLSKPLIGTSADTQVIGVDISANMRALATSCVASDEFFAMHPDMLRMLPEACDFAVAVWTLQHCFAPGEDIERIRNTITDGSNLFVVNNVRRVVPVGDGRWADDQIDIDAMIRAGGFDLIERGTLDDDAIAPVQLRANTFWAVYRKT